MAYRDCSPEEAREIVSKAIASGLIKPADEESVKVPKQRNKRGKLAKMRKDRKMCPRCERMVQAVRGNVIRHREDEDVRGYGNGAWCEYSEV